MNGYVRKVVRHRLQSGKQIIECQRQHAKRMVIIPRNIFSKYYFQIVRRKRPYVGIIRYIKIIIPQRKLIMKRIPEANKSQYGNSRKQ